MSTESETLGAAERLRGNLCILNLCLGFQERVMALGYKGKKRDNAAVDYFVGAAQVASTLGSNIAHKAIGNFTAFAVAIHGYAAIERHLAEHKEAPAETT
jgi:hypothetical protein